jgi:hypothetical protein
MADEEYDRLIRVERAKELMQDMAEFQKQAFANAAGQAINNGLAKALKENNLTVEDWQRIYTGAPETTLRKQEEQMHRFASKLIAKATKGQRAPDEKPTTSAGSLRQGGQRPRSSDSKDLSGIVEQQRGGKLSSDKALDKMLEMSLGDYFRRTMSE